MKIYKARLLYVTVLLDNITLFRHDLIPAVIEKIAQYSSMCQLMNFHEIRSIHLVVGHVNGIMIDYYEM